MSEDTISERPWGQYQKLYQEGGIWVKRIEVQPNKRLSLQKHKYRSEKWIIVSGTGRVIVQNKKIFVEKGSVVDIPKTVCHRIENTNDSPLIFIEIAIGKYLGEDDIERIADDYNRKLN